MTDREPTAPLRAEVVVQRGAEAERIPFGPTDTLRFITEGGPGLPDLYEERSARGDGPPLHSHPWPSWELVLDGQVRFAVADGEHILGSGDSIFIPAGEPHTYVVESDTAHAVGVGLSDGRFPSLQRKAAPLMATEGGPPMDDVAALAAEHGVELLGPPMSLDTSPTTTRS